MMSRIAKISSPLVIKSPQWFAIIPNNNEEQSLLAKIHKQSYVVVFTMTMEFQDFL